MRHSQSPRRHKYSITMRLITTLIVGMLAGQTLASAPSAEEHVKCHVIDKTFLYYHLRTSVLAPDGSQTYQKDRISSATLRPVSSVLFVDGKPYKGRYGRLSVTYHPSQKDGILTYHLPIFVDRVRDNPVKWLAKNRKFLETAAPKWFSKTHHQSSISEKCHEI